MRVIFVRPRFVIGAGGPFSKLYPTKPIPKPLVHSVLKEEF